MAIKKGILCQDEAKTQPVYPYTQTDCVFDEDTNLPQENINQSLAGSLATIETSPSTSAHSVGEYIVFNYQLYKVISAISAGANLVENTNIQKVSLANDITNVISGTSAITTSHDLRQARAVTIGKVYLANITVALTSNVSAWVNIFTLNNVSIPLSQYFIGNINGNDTKMFYIGVAGNVQCTASLTSGTEIKIPIFLILS